MYGKSHNILNKNLSVNCSYTRKSPSGGDFESDQWTDPEQSNNNTQVNHTTKGTWADCHMDVI